MFSSARLCLLLCFIDPLLAPSTTEVASRPAADVALVAPDSVIAGFILLHRIAPIGTHIAPKRTEQSSFDYIASSMLGRGSQGETWLAKRRQTGGLFVLKRLFRHAWLSGYREQWMGQNYCWPQAPNWQRLRTAGSNLCGKITAFVEQFWSSCSSGPAERACTPVLSRKAKATELWLVFEFEGRSLRQLLYGMPRENTTEPTPSATWTAMRASPTGFAAVSELARQLVHNLIAIHNHHIIHRDIKPSNLLLTQRAGNISTIKLADFGAAVHLDNINELYGTPGPQPGDSSLEYAPPEAQLRGQAYDETLPSSYDMWGLGVTVLETWLARTPDAVWQLDAHEEQHAARSYWKQQAARTNHDKHGRPQHDPPPHEYFLEIAWRQWCIHPAQTYRRAQVVPLGSDTAAMLERETAEVAEALLYGTRRKPEWATADADAPQGRLTCTITDFAAALRAADLHHTPIRAGTSNAFGRASLHDQDPVTAYDKLPRSVSDVHDGIPELPPAYEQHLPSDHGELLGSAHSPITPALPSNTPMCTAGPAASGLLSPPKPPAAKSCAASALFHRQVAPDSEANAQSLMQWLRSTERRVATASETTCCSTRTGVSDFPMCVAPVPWCPSPWEAWCGVTCFEDEQNSAGIGDEELAPDELSLVAHAFVDFLWGLLQWKPRERLSAEAALQHPFILWFAPDTE